MLELNPLAVTSADLLRAIDAGGWVTRTELAESVGRKPNNISRDLGVLESAGLIAVDPDKAAARPLTLTPEGQAQLAAIARAQHGGDPRRPRDRCLVANIIANPANRRVEAEAVAALADTIEAVGDVLESIQLTPADANGVRMLLDGEHRWRAVQLLAEQDRLPPALEKGLRFEEREATEAEQILIRIVTATARADLSPLDDARQLLALQKATGWSATEIAKKTGRSPVDSNTGVRGVQSKIRVAREATEFFLKQYELDGSWDRLRDSVTEKKPAAAEPPLSLDGGGGASAEGDPTTAGGEGDVSATPPLDDAPQADAAEEPSNWLLDNPDWRSTEVETRNGGHSLQLRIFERIGAVPGWYVSISTNLQDGGVGESYRVSDRNPIYSNRIEALQAARRRVIDRHPLAPPWVRNWLDQQMGPNFVNGRDCLNASNAGEARRAAGLEARKSNSGGGSPGPTERPSVPGPSSPTPPPPDSLSDRADRMRVAAINGSEFVLSAAIAELIEAIDSHLAGIRRDLVQGGQDLAPFEEDTEHLREIMARAGDAIEALGLGEGEGLAPTEERTKPPTLAEPFVPIRKSITPEHVTCLYDGRRFAAGLRRHLLTRYNETPDEYRRKWALPADYPMVAPNHAKRQHDALRAAALRIAGVGSAAR